MMLRLVSILRAIAFIGATFAALSLPSANAARLAEGRERLSFDTDWRFALGNAADPHADFDFGVTFSSAGAGTGPVKASFDDSKWRAIRVPHDWAVELPFDQSADKSHGFKPIGRKFPATSVGWYRRHFNVPATDLGRRVTIEFDGVFRDSRVWLNGHYLGRHESGYTSFGYDLTDLINYGGENVLVVRVDASEFEGWFYEGAGIYRHVWLVKTASVHVAHWGTFVTSEVRGDRAELTIQTEIVNESAAATVVELRSNVFDEAGRSLGATVTPALSLHAGEQREITQHVEVAKPQLWAPGAPNLYHLASEIRSNETAIDAYATTFGIRTIHFDPNQGVLLNGRRIEIKGTCNHQDHAGVGAALPDALQVYRLERLLAMGSNAYRTSHNPPTPELLDACDRLGVLVLDEHRMVGSGPEILGELEDTIRRDRNHPSVFLWSLGNEETAIQGTEVGARTIATMQRRAHALDPSRSCTVAMNYKWGSGFSTVIDVMGINYIFRFDLDEYHRQHPNQPIIGTEDASNVSTRGIYATDWQHGYLRPYDETARTEKEKRSSPEKWWPFYAARPYLPGAFIWTGFDYRGEPTPFGWPVISSHFGVLDTCGFPKEYFYYYQSWWTDQPVLKIFPHWNWPGREGEPIEVRIYSNADEVELALNGRSLGRKPVPRNGHVAWDVKYQAGVLQAHGFKGGVEISADTVETTDAAAAIRLESTRRSATADGSDVVVVNATVIDAKGRVVPTADNALTFAVTNGAIIGVGNGDPSSHEPDQASQRHAFNGCAQAIVQATDQPGTLVIHATGAGLAAGELSIPVVAPRR
jgi:beta-galactosidase